MPFAGYKDFAACVVANQDRGNPEAYCAFIENKVKAEEIMPNFEDRVLLNVPIFTQGHLTDSMGMERDFTDNDISDIIDAFSKGVPPSVPVKIGHSSDQFNDKVATALGIPKELITGEGEGNKGQVRLGSIIAVKKGSDGGLTADVKVSEPVGKLIKDGLLTGLSSELQFNRKQGDTTFPTVLSGLALLGVQRPALSDLPSLQEATMLEDGTHADAVYFSDLDFNKKDSFTLDEGSAMAPNSLAGSGGDQERVFTVPFNDLTRGRQVFASVSAPNEITAKRTALRVIENFLFSIGGPLGTALGITGGAIASARLIAGRPVLGGVKGLIRWKFEEPYDLGSDAMELTEIRDRIESALGITKKGDKDITMTNRYAEHPDMASCIEKAKADGKEDPAAFCRNKFDEEAASKLSELGKSLNLTEWDSDSILVRVKELVTAKEAGSKFEEDTTKQIGFLTHENRVFHFQEETSKLELVPGTPKENAEKLATLEGKAGAETATMMLESWQAQEKSAQEAKVSKSVLKPGHDLEEGEFSEAITKYKEEHKDASEAEAIKETMRSNPELAANRNN